MKKNCSSCGKFRNVFQKGLCAECLAPEIKRLSDFITKQREAMK